ncbi:beta-ketoacyl-ACP synthase III [Streptomyces sp. AM 2-1-1]|uniref:beta-ketoacyl-ACP synthase III n=1 Tax=Streptomyces sp. AM 2-1-1 TaxID=3028709 RepID=UPI0023BA1B5D|nr:beta-ketoacyl-ACP synthase III [Streptomyces sp. AM 2-1-1]WEH43181.1 ketoacyl-ACP synthase III [Streptomyces sp. AM 2-1-1]
MSAGTTGGGSTESRSKDGSRAAGEAAGSPAPGGTAATAGGASEPAVRGTATLRAAAPVAGSRILGVGAYRPARVVENDEVAGPIDSSDEWIRRRSGIVSRRFAAPDETVVAMAAAASLKALAQAGVAPSSVDTVLLASMSHREQSPPAAPRIAHLIGARSAGAMDLGAACAGFCHALATADALIRSGSSRNVVVVGSERMSDIVDPTDRGTAFLFGDGAGAVVVGPAAEPGIGPVVWGSEGDRHEAIAHSAPWPAVGAAAGTAPPTLRMDGPAVFRWAVATVPGAARAALDAAGLAPGDLAAFVPHQANLRIIEGAAAALRLPPHVVVARDIVRAGNTSAASIPLALEELLARGAVPRGGLALLVGFGAGLAHAAQVVALP